MNWRSERGEVSVGQDWTFPLSDCITSQGEFSKTVLPNTTQIRKKPTWIYLTTFGFMNKLGGADTTNPTVLKYGVDKTITNHEQKQISTQGSRYTDPLHGIHFHTCS